MTLFFILISEGVALFLDAVIRGAFLFGYLPPLSFFLAIGWFMKLELRANLILALAVGFILDSIRFFPFGTYMAVFIVAACMTAWLKTFFHQTGSRVASVLGGGMVVLLSWILIIPVGGVLAQIR